MTVQIRLTGEPETVEKFVELLRDTEGMEISREEGPYHNWGGTGDTRQYIEVEL